MTPKPTQPQAPMLLGKPMRKFAGHGRVAQWRTRIGHLEVVVTTCSEPKFRAWRIEGLRGYGRDIRHTRGSVQLSANAAGKVLEQLAKAIRGER